MASTMFFSSKNSTNQKHTESGSRFWEPAVHYLCVEGKRSKCYKVEIVWKHRLGYKEAATSDF